MGILRFYIFKDVTWTEYIADFVLYNLVLFWKL